MKRKLKLVNILLVAVFVCSLAISPTDARRGARKQVASRGRQTLNLGAISPMAQLAQGEDQKEQLVSGQLIQTERQDPELTRSLQDYDLIRLDAQAAAAQVRKTGKLLISTSNGNFDMQLAPYDMRAPDYVSQVITADGLAHKLPKAPLNTYKGSVAGSSVAQARMTVKEGSIEGAILTEKERYFIQPARSLSRNAKDDEFVFYRGSDVINEGATCGVTLADEVAAEETRTDSYRKTIEAAETAGPITGLSPLKIARLATEADAEYVSALGGAAQANAQIASIMNLVDGIYQVEIGVTFQIAFQNAWANAATDPYTSTAAGTLLGEFRNYWNTNFASVQRNLAHIWTGKDLDMGVIGIATLAVVCRTPQQAYGLSQRFPVNPSNPVTAQTVVLTAHEIGHNFSAVHTDDPLDAPPDIERACKVTIMESFVGNGSSFCPFSRSQIIGHANAYGSCLADSASGPPPLPTCVEIPIDSTGFSANGELSTTDCRSLSRGVNYFADRYSFNGTAGQQLSITMIQSPGSSLDTYVCLIGPDGYLVSQNHDSFGDTSRIPYVGKIALPLTGKYIIEATSFAGQQTGSYTVAVAFAGCTLSVSPTSQHFPVSGGVGTISVTASGGGCGDSYVFTSDPNPLTWLNPQISGGSGSQALNFNVQPNTNAAGRRAFLLVGTGINSLTGNDFTGGLSIPITQSGTGPDCSLTPIASGQTLNGSLSTTDCQSPVRGNFFYSDRYSFSASAGDQVTITMSGGSNPDSFLTLIGPNGVVLLTDDDGGGGNNARIPGGNGALTLGLSGTHIIEAGAFNSGATGPYTLTLTTIAAPPSNPIDDARTFVRQQYLDFLSREPDQGGWDYWTSQITQCGSDQRCIHLRRIDVSAAFFIEAEFQRTGSFVYRSFKGGLGRRPTFAEFSADRPLIVEGPTLEISKQAYSLAFVQRAEFLAKYAGRDTDITFVDALIASILTNSGLNLAGQRQLFIDAYNTGSNPNQRRAFALRAVIDNTSFTTAEYNPSFVVMQYLGYLQRSPEQGGYDFWLDVLNNRVPGNFRGMVCAFLTSAEYQQRFGSSITRTDRDCGP